LRKLARKANAKIIPGSLEAIDRTAKAREERKEAFAAAKLRPTEG
jgi:hypothetical protein